MWSVGTNKRFRHKIVLDTSAHPPGNEWLGVTFRTSKTFLQFDDDDEEGRACFEDGTPLALASDEQRKEFYQLRRRENQSCGTFTYPQLHYTISESDLLPPTPAEAPAVGLAGAKAA